MLTGNPVRDAEENALKGLDRPCIHCDICGGTIYQASDMYHGDDYYDMDNLVICTDCIDKFRKECI